MIFFITNKEDITTDFIINKLNQRGTHYYRLNTEDLANSVGINFDFDNGVYEIIDKNKMESINLSKVKSVYFRRPRIPDIENSLLSDSENFLIKNEIAYTLEGLYKILSDKFWISPVFSIREAENKIYQLILAKELGFKIPSSLITTNEVNAKNFIQKNYSNCIIKPIKSGFIDDKYNPKVIFTSVLNKEQLNELNRVCCCPTYFQNNINKSADIRVTVVGKKTFSAKICSQEFKETKVDWRKGNNTNLKYDHYTLDSATEKKCIKLLEHLKLNFGAIDFVLNKNGELIFLEINPNGQWGWIEKRLNLEIGRASCRERV